MRTIGVVCEFNPFHSGHAYLLNRMRAEVGEGGCVVALMSGRFVQRGTPAMADPYLRAEMAILGGADLVLELPFPWSAGSAEHFATAGMRLLTGLGVDAVAFGSECGDLSCLRRAAEAVESLTFGETYAALCREGRGTTVAYAEALRAVAENLPKDFPASNDLLGIAYLRALKLIEAERGVPVPVLTVHRKGAGYREDVLTADTYPSATALRRLIKEAACDPVALAAILEGSMPAEALACLLTAMEHGDAPLDEDALLPYYHAFYRLHAFPEGQEPAELGGGLSAHIGRRARESATPDAFFATLRTKQYTDARLRRAMLFGVTGVYEADLRAVPTYTTVLAATARGCACLKAWQKARQDDRHDWEHHDRHDREHHDRHDRGKENRPLTVTKPADAPMGRQRELAERADALFTLCYLIPRAAGEFLKKSPVIRL